MREQKTYHVTDAAMEAQTDFASGFLQADYQEALEKEFNSRFDYNF
jgi:hypothetical protein